MPHWVDDETYTFRVGYDDGSFLLESDPCPDIPESCHVFACVDKKRAVFIELAGTNLRVDCAGENVEPVFFRRRVQEVNVTEGTQTTRRDMFSTWIGYRVVEENTYESLLEIGEDGQVILRRGR